MTAEVQSSPADEGSRFLKWHNFSDTERTQVYLQGILLSILLGVFFIVVDLCWLGGSSREWIKPERIITIVTLLAGVFLLLYQLNRQHRSALEANKQEARLKLRVEIYRDLSSTSEAASQAVLSSLSAIVETVMDGALRRDLAAVAPEAHFTRGKTDEALTTQAHQTTTALVGLLASMDRWQIALGDDFSQLRSDLSVSIAGLQLWARQFNVTAATFFDVSPRHPRAPENLANLSRIGEGTQRAGFAVIAVLSDVSASIQRMLLGELFTGRPVVTATATVQPFRLPDDPSQPWVGKVP